MENHGAGIFFAIREKYFQKRFVGNQKRFTFDLSKRSNEAARKAKLKVMNIQTLLIENSNRPGTQQQIREAAVRGAADAGYNLIVGYDNQVKAGTKETYENFEAATVAAIEEIKVSVSL